jgi:hypothetical protein
MKEIAWEKFANLLLLSVVVSFFISYLYITFYKNRGTGSQIHRSFPLLGLSITTIFICIQFSLPLSLGLLGALSIVRFRTPIKEPEEIGFLMVVIASSICTATLNLTFLGILIALTFACLLFQNKGPRFIKRRLNDGLILVTLPTTEYREMGTQIIGYLEKNLGKGRLDSITENEDESSLSYSFTHMQDKQLLDVQNGLKNMGEQIKANIFFNRASQI